MFGINNDELVKLVLNNKKIMTTSLYSSYDLSKNNNLSVITDSNDNSVCLIKTKKNFIRKFKDVTWSLASLEGEDDSLDKWRENHIKFLKRINNNFNENKLVNMELFEVIEKWK